MSIKKRKPIDKKKHSTRKSFVGFAMPFLEMEKPGLFEGRLIRTLFLDLCLFDLWSV